MLMQRITRPEVPYGCAVIFRSARALHGIRQVARRHAERSDLTAPVHASRGAEAANTVLRPGQEPPDVCPMRIDDTCRISRLGSRASMPNTYLLMATVDGKAMAARIDASETYRDENNTTAKTPSVINMVMGVSAKRTPADVFTPFPPLNPT